MTSSQLFALIGAVLLLSSNGFLEFVGGWMLIASVIVMFSL